MLNFRRFRRSAEHTPVGADCIFRARAVEQWQESVTAYRDVIQMLATASEDEYEAILESAQRVRRASQDIKQILDEHEREHHCGHRAPVVILQQVSAKTILL
jgi:hypothetical protein